LDEAIAEYREAIRLKKDYAEAHNNLGIALYAKGALDEAIAEYREAIRLKKDLAAAHNNLGSALATKGEIDQAIAEFREAIGLKKDYAEAHDSLGIALRNKGALDEAIAEHREAIRLKKDYAAAHLNLGNAVHNKGALDEAIAEYREAIRLKKDYAQAHYSLAIALETKRKWPEAEQSYRKAIAFKPDYAEAYCNLPTVLQQQGRFAEALAAAKKGDELGRRTPGWRYPSAQWVREAEQFAALDGKLSKVLDGDARAGAGESIVFAQICEKAHRMQYAAAARFFAAAFAEQPKLAEDFRAHHRYNAACAAALAGCGQGKDADGLSEKERADLRQQALDWLRADLAAHSAQLTKEPERAGPVVIKMQHWQADTDLAGVRGDSQTTLPPDERQAWQQLWADVAKTLARAQSMAVPQKQAGKK
jgi:tetratricopeptide (TPR) repeat protein